MAAHSEAMKLSDCDEQSR